MYGVAQTRGWRVLRILLNVRSPAHSLARYCVFGHVPRARSQRETEQRRGKKAESVEGSADRVCRGCGSRAESRERGRRKGAWMMGRAGEAGEEEGEAVLTLGDAWLAGWLAG